MPRRWPGRSSRPARAAGGRLGRRILEILMEGVSTRAYRKVLPEVAEAVRVWKSQVSRAFIDASEEALKTLAARRFGDKDLLVIYLDGLILDGHHVLSAIGVDVEGYRHVLGLVEGASENAAAATALLEDLATRGVSKLPDWAQQQTNRGVAWGQVPPAVWDLVAQWSTWGRGLVG